uniref:Uncharacterized protein n=1 Tax=Tanacetum cinerariifolium TaxID=118510 RepID=A0A6L2KAD0_TANCI|nr:hypothetical protein [Tanacetum cinerariifolium]
MVRPLFNRIVNAVTNHDAYFRNNIGCTGREGISPLIKCTSAIRQLTYDENASFLDEYMQISKRSSRMALDHFCEAVMDIYGPEHLRKPTEKHVTWARFGKKLDKNATFQAPDFHSDAFIKSAQTVKFLIKFVTSQCVEMTSEFNPDAVISEERQHHHEL